MAQANQDKKDSLVEGRGRSFNPFPGLKPFTIYEKHLFFGREGQSEKILDLLKKNRFAAVIGPSGTGKSSLINSGVVPMLYAGYLYEAGAEWTLVNFSPGYNPLENLSRGIAQGFASKKTSVSKMEAETNLNYALFRKKSKDLNDLIKQQENFQGENILIFIDQFEELFRFPSALSQEDSKKRNDDVLQFINLLIESLQQKQSSVFIVLCIRSDFVGHCSNYKKLTDYINESHFLVSQMSRDDFRKAIVKPLSYVSANLSPDLLNEILNNVSNRTDQLPVLQHLMMRMFDKWLSKNKPSQAITHSDYKAVGGLENAISIHADEVYNQLSEKHQNICKRIFQTITESGPDNRGIRRPTSIKTLSEIIKAEVDDIIHIANQFRKEGNSFITPAHYIKLTADTILDISHEAVMRNWERLKMWMEEESDAVQMYYRLVEASDLYQSGKTGTWRPPELLLAIQWKNEFGPNEIWAAQYHKAYARSIKFLEVSEKTYADELAEKEHQQKREIRRTRWFAVILGIAALISLGFMFNSQYLKKVADRARQKEEEQRKLAEMNALEAEKQKNIALQYADEVEDQNQLIEELLAITEVERDSAVRTADDALNRASLTEMSLLEVSRDREIAEKTAQEVLEQKQLAEKEKDEAFREKMLLLAQSLSNTATSIEDDRFLKALLALQAFKFNQEYQGPENLASVYEGLKEALHSLNVRYKKIIPGHSEVSRSLAYDRSKNILYSAGSDGKLIRWQNESSYKDPLILTENNSINRILELSANGRWLLCGIEGTGIQVFDLRKPDQKPKMLNAHENRVRSIAVFNDNRRMLTGGIDNTVLEWDLESVNQNIFIDAGSPVLSLAVSHNDRYVAAGTRDGKLLLIEEGTSSPVEIINEPNNQILSLTFRKKDNLLICGDQQGNLRIWSLLNNNLIFYKKLHQARIVEIKLDPSETFIATASTDGKVLLLDTEAINQPPIEIVDQDEFIFSVEFINEGKELAVGGRNSNNIIRYPVYMSDLARLICPNISRNLSQAEWSNYIGNDIAYAETCD